MKKSGIIAATTAASAAAAAAAAAATSSATSSATAFSFNTRYPHHPDGETSKERENSSDKFAPRFDGLRFIETLVTAHR